MTSAQARFQTGRNKWRGISLPAMAPFAGLVFMVVCFYMPTGQSKLNWKKANTGIVSEHEVPVSYGACVPEGDEIIISLNRSNQLSFAVSSETFCAQIQAHAIKQVAARHDIIFTPNQLASLVKLPYLATDIRQLPLLLMQRRGMLPIPPEKQHSLPLDQLSECVAAGMAMAPRFTKRRLNVKLFIDGQVRTPQVEQIINMLQAQGINRFNLQTRYQ